MLKWLSAHLLQEEVTTVTKQLRWAVVLMVGWLLCVVSSASAVTAVVESGASGNEELYVWVPGGSLGANLTHNSGGDYEPAVSPDGSKVAFTSDRSGVVRGLYLMDSDGSHVRRLGSLTWTDGPAWSPDGSQLAYTASNVLYEIDLDGNNNHRIGNDAVTNTPNWSPDGLKLVYSRYIGWRWQLQIITASAGVYTQSVSITTPTSDVYDLGPVWSPDGSQIAFYSNRSIRSSDDIYTVSPDGSNLALRGQAAVGVSRCRMYPQWGAGGGVLYFTQNSCGSDRFIYEMSASGGAASLASGGGYINALSIQQPKLPAVPAPYRYVALGDSVAAGEGINYGWAWSTQSNRWFQTTSRPDWVVDTLASDGQSCHQSAESYPQILFRDAGLDASSFGDFACTGASVAEGLLHPESWLTSLPQLGIATDKLNSQYEAISPDIVTVTVGADDVNFSSIMHQCYEPSSSNCNLQPSATVLDFAIGLFGYQLSDLLNEIKLRGEQQGHIPRVVLTTYYDPFPTSYDSSCRDLNIESLWRSGAVLTAAEMQWLRSELASLNAVIGNIAARYDNVQLVSLTDVMTGHTLCSSDPWVFGPSLALTDTAIPRENGNPAPFHPTADGQIAIANRIKRAIG